MATPQDKQRDLNELIAQGVVMLHLDARRPGVKLPADFRTDMQLRLNFNHTKGKGDLTVDWWGVRETLRFKGVWTPTAIPWSAIYAMSVQGLEPKVYAEDLPEEMVEAALARLQREGVPLERLEENRPRSLWEAADTLAPPSPAPMRPVTPVLAAVPMDPSPAEPPAAEASAFSPPDAGAVPPPEAAPPRRGHLRLVK
jgi:stringent starvation protein B